MNKLALVAIILLAGCAATNTRTDGSDSRLTQLEEKSRIIAAREKQCIDKTLARSRDEITGTTSTPDASAQSQMQKEGRERDREVLECHAKADQENAEIYAHERDEYELQAQQERHRAALIVILTTSGPR
jgi:hypothetical protein